MKQTKLLFLLCLCCLVQALSAQTGFTNQNNLLTPVDHHSGVAIAVLDMNGDGLDDIVRMNQGHQLAIEYQTGANQAFTHFGIGDVGTNSQWGMCAADIDNNGFPDILVGGKYDGIKILMANATGSAFNTTNMTTPSTFVQGVNFADINNDGWLDAFVCHDDGPPRIFANNGAGGFTYTPGWMDVTTLPPSDGSGNYGTVWSDVNNDGHLDLYIAKCRQGVNNPADGRRINQLFLNNGDNTYTQDTGNLAGLRFAAQSWTADFGDIDNDGDMDCFVTHHDVTSRLLENDGSGHFTDISASAGMGFIGGLPIQGVFRDFDNDGFMDILVAGSIQYLLHNNGDKTFTIISNLFNNKVMESFAVGDLNHDGFIDIYGGYGDIYTTPTTNPDVLWMNNGNSNHFFGLNLQGVQSNRNGVGARVTLYSSLGVQVREVRSGESYGIMNSMQINFGIGQVTTIDSVVVRWPSGIVDKLYQPAINQYVTLQEGGCLVPPVAAIADGPTTFCTGQSVQLGTTDFFNQYAWSTGDTSAVLTVTAAGLYTVTVTTANGCTAVSSPVAISTDPVEIPNIFIAGDTTFCSGGTVTLTASASTSYFWNTGETTQSISASQDGIYSVTTQGLCALFTSAPQAVHVLDALAPTVANDTVWVGGTATLTATGNNVVWYDSPGAANSFYTGNAYETQALTETDTFWVSSTSEYDQPNLFTGMTDHQGTLLSGNGTNGQIIFDCFKPFRLTRVKVYSAIAADRKIILVNSAGDTLQSLTVNVPVGTTVIDLNFDIPVGTNLMLTTDQAVNQASLGTNSPQLRRSSEGMTYPYVIPGVVSINGANTAAFTDRYYYFYNWEVDFYAFNCISDRVPVLAVVDPSLVQASEPAWGKSLKVFPNPSSGALNLELDGFAGGEVSVSWKNVQGATLQTQQRDLPAGKMNWQANLNGFAKGIYWVEVATNQGVVRRKVVVQ